jgi:23S rRNA pseudouridine2457 synthase
MSGCKQSMSAHFKIFKPDGFLSQFINNGPQKRRIRLLGELGSFPEQTMAIGRLDLHSEGLLLLTTDGKLSDHICRGGVEKEYYALLDGNITDEAIAELRGGLTIMVRGEPHQTKPCVVHRLIEPPELPQRNKRIRDSRHGPSSWVSVVLSEGKNRQVRKMTAAVGFPTLRLIRVRVGDIELGDMQPGEVRALKEEKLKAWLS